MAGLVADYGSGSSSGSDNDSNFTDSDEDYIRVSGNFEDEQLNEPGLAAPIVRKPSFKDDYNNEELIGNEQNIDENVMNEVKVTSNDAQVDNYDEDDESADSDDSPDDEPPRLAVEVEEQVVERLPNPLLSKQTKPEPQHSVFSTEYDHREAAKRSVLEKHVKLTDDELEKQKNRPVCKGFLKGKCRYGLRCKFKHQKDEPNHAEEKTTENPTSKTVQHKPVMLQSGHRMEYQPEPEDEDKYGNQTRKRRYGVKDSLVPPKMALKNLDRMREYERPWTNKK